MNASLRAHRIEATLTENETLTLDHLPFQEGEAVEAIVLPNRTSLPAHDRYPLREIPIQYQEPTEPVAEQDWEALP